jgi:hypothetical protein
MNDGIRPTMTIGCDIAAPMLITAQNASARRAYLEVEAQAEAVPEARRYTKSAGAMGAGAGRVRHRTGRLRAGHERDHGQRRTADPRERGLAPRGLRQGRLGAARPRRSVTHTRPTGQRNVPMRPVYSPLVRGYDVTDS